jgi:hypothetical protein
MRTAAEAMKMGPNQRKPGLAKTGCILGVAGALAGAIAGLVATFLIYRDLNTGVPEFDAHGFLLIVLLALACISHSVHGTGGLLAA